MNIIHLGGEYTVTGSCHLIRTKGLNFLVDCGIAQGNDFVCVMESWPVAPSDIDYLFLTHAHIDHIGRVPELIQNGFKGEILTSHPTKGLLGPMLIDAMGFTHMSSNRVAKMSGIIDELSWGFEYNEEFDLKKGIAFKLGRAGHILGSCWVQLNMAEQGSVVFSGDLGAENAPLLCDPDIPDGCDILILESTYGDRMHEDRGDRVRVLGKILARALKDKGKVFIPCFALGRTQELIYEMDRLFSDQKLRTEFPELSPRNKIPVFVDSPLGLEITNIYSKLSDYWDSEAQEILQRGDHPIDFKHLYGVKEHRDHLQLLDMEGPAIILAGSGMCTGGRIRGHLKNGISDPKNDILFVGYQAMGTPGREILINSKVPVSYVVLEGEKFL